MKHQSSIRKFSIIWCLLLAGLMKYLGKGTTGKIIEETDEKMDRLLKTFKDNLQNKYNRQNHLILLFTFQINCENDTGDPHLIQISGLGKHCVMGNSC